MRKLAAMAAVWLCLATSQATPESSAEAPPSDSGIPKERDSAVAAGYAYLHMLDQGKYEEAWSAASPLLRMTNSQSTWITTLKTMRAPEGRLKRRTPIDGAFTTKLENAPPGHYYAIFYRSEFERATIREKVVMNLEAGTWRLVGYFVTKTVPVDSGVPSERAAAIAAGDSCLHMVDGGRYEESWSALGQLLQRTVSQSDWTTHLRNLRALAGRLKTRALIAAAFVTEVENAPPGRYFVVLYKSEFERTTVQEKVVVSLEGGTWRVVGYGFEAPTKPGRTGDR
jgi:hypothetical protein